MFLTVSDKHPHIKASVVGCQLSETGFLLRSVEDPLFIIQGRFTAFTFVCFIAPNPKETTDFFLKEVDNLPLF